MEVMPQEIKINDISFTPRPDCHYKHDYAYRAYVLQTPSEWHKAIGVPADTVLTSEYVQRCLFRHLVLNDLWFIIYFVMGIKQANHPFWVKMCRVVENSPATKVLHIWARSHGKSSIITIAQTTQFHLRYPEKCTCIFSYKFKAASKFLAAVKANYENPFLYFLFPEILWQFPNADAPSWSAENGISLKRKSTSRANKTVECSGLVEGMLTGGHFERRIYDDVETADSADSADEQEKILNRFEMSAYLGTGSDDDIEIVIGTFYSHNGPNVKIRDKKKANGTTPYYHSVIIPGTADATWDGAPVLLSQEKLDDEKNREYYASQILCDPTPLKTRKLNSSYLKDIEPELIPKGVLKFMVVDPAGESNGKKGCDWAVLILGVEPKPDELGASNIYLLSAFVDQLTEAEAPEVVSRMYLSGGIIQKMGVEKVAQATAEMHIASALAAHGRRISIDDGSLVILRPGGRQKIHRIEKALAWPLNNGKLHMSNTIPKMYRDKIRLSMDQFPFGKLDGIDAWSYLYDENMLNADDLRRYQRATVSTFNWKPFAPKTSIA